MEEATAGGKSWPVAQAQAPGPAEVSWISASTNGCTTWCGSYVNPNRGVCVKGQMRPALSSLHADDSVAERSTPMDTLRIVLAERIPLLTRQFFSNLQK